MTEQERSELIRMLHPVPGCVFRYSGKTYRRMTHEWAELDTQPWCTNCGYYPTPGTLINIGTETQPVMFTVKDYDTSV